MSDENVTDVWVIPAKAKKLFQDEDFGAALHSGLYNEQSVESASVLSVNGQSSQNVSLAMADLPIGY